MTIETTRIGPRPLIAVDHAGAGELVLFLHGIGGNRGNWRDQLLAFAPYVRAAAWDARGYGASDDYDGPLRFADLAADLLRVLDHFAAARAHLVGLSMGGIIAQDFCHRHPNRVASLVLADTGTGPRPGRDDSWVEAFLRARKAPLLAGKSPRDIAPELARSLVSPAAAPEAVRRVVDSISALRAESYLKALETVTRHAVPLDHGSVAVPVLVVVGSADTLTPPAAARRLAGAIPGARLAVIEDAGHLSNIERPDEFNRAVLDFLLAAAPTA